MYSTYGTYNGYDAYNYGNTAGAAAGAAAGLAGAMIVFYVLYWIIAVAWVVFTYIGMWKSFAKMGKKGYEALISGHNTLVILEKAKMPMWNYFLLLIPIYGIIVGIKACIQIAKKFGKGTGFAVLLVLLPPIGWSLLGLGKAKYKD